MYKKAGGIIIKHIFTIGKIIHNTPKVVNTIRICKDRLTNQDYKAECLELFLSMSKEELIVFACLYIGFKGPIQPDEPSKHSKIPVMELMIKKDGLEKRLASIGDRYVENEYAYIEQLRSKGLIAAQTYDPKTNKIINYRATYKGMRLYAYCDEKNKFPPEFTNSRNNNFNESNEIRKRDKIIYYIKSKF